MSSVDFVWPPHRPPLNDPLGPYQVLFATTARRPERKAIVFRNHHIIYRELESVDAVARNPSGKIFRRVLKDRVRHPSP